MSQAQYHPLKVSKIIEETKNARSIVFEVPAELQDAYQFDAGQYLTIRCTLDGEEYRRCYSMSSAPYENVLKISVKKLEGGKVSSFLVDTLQEGDVLDIATPEGRFTHLLDPERKAQYYFFGAGSGITPLYSHIKEILENEPLSTVYLLYGNKTSEDSIYREELEQLAVVYQNQFYLKNCYSQEKKGLNKLLKRFRNQVGESNYSGRIDDSNLKLFFEEFPVKHKNKFAFICGPVKMDEVIESFLSTKDWHSTEIHYESFGLEEGTHVSSKAFVAKANITVELNDETFTLEMPGNKTILEAVLEEGKNPPYSCEAGACSSCIAKVIKGNAEMDLCYSLDDDEVEAGYILTCQAKPTTEELQVRFV